MYTFVINKPTIATAIEMMRKGYSSAVVDFIGKSPEIDEETAMYIYRFLFLTGYNGDKVDTSKTYRFNNYNVSATETDNYYMFHLVEVEPNVAQKIPSISDSHVSEETTERVYYFTVQAERNVTLTAELCPEPPEDFEEYLQVQANTVSVAYLDTYNAFDKIASGYILAEIRQQALRLVFGVATHLFVTE